VIDRGSLVAWLGRRGRALSVWLADEGPERARVAAAVSEALGRAVDSGRLPPLSLEAIDDGPAVRSALVQAIVRAGFVLTATSLLRRRGVVAPPTRAGAFDRAANDVLDAEGLGDALDEDFDDGLDHDPDDPLAPDGLDDVRGAERDGAAPYDLEGPR
jgi:hypothetical protein